MSSISNLSTNASLKLFEDLRLSKSFELDFFMSFLLKLISSTKDNRIKFFSPSVKQEISFEDNFAFTHILFT